MHETDSTQSVQYREIELSQGVLQYRDEGSGAPIVLVHGLLVNGGVWDRLIPLLAEGARCIVPELPLGSHRIPMGAGADMSPGGVARLIAELLERLELEDVTLVGNDTGGALCQLVAAHHGERIGRLVLTNCDSFEHFPPPKLRGPVASLKLPGVVELLGRLGQRRRVTGLVSRLQLTVDPIPDALASSWLVPLRDAGVRADLARFVRAISADETVAAAELLRGFDRPALVAWGVRDPYFPFSDAQRLAATLPQARLERIEDARTFVQFDAPGRLAELIGELMASTTADKHAAAS